jgi:hypothetical protein
MRPKYEVKLNSLLQRRPFKVFVMWKILFNVRHIQQSFLIDFELIQIDCHF